MSKLETLIEALQRTVRRLGTAARTIVAGSGISVVDSGTTVTVAATYTAPTTAPVFAVKSSDQTLIGTAFTDVSATGLAVAANKTYWFKFLILVDADATTTGIDIAVNGPAGATRLAYKQFYYTSATASGVRGASAYDSNTANTASNGTAVRAFEVEGVLVNGANPGNLTARAKREAVGTGPNVRAGSFGMLVQLN